MIFCYRLSDQNDICTHSRINSQRSEKNEEFSKILRTTAGTKNDWSFPTLYFWLVLFMEGDNESVVVALKDQSIKVCN